MSEFTELDRKQWLIDALRKKINRIKEQRQDDIDEIRKEERLAFADWLGKFSRSIDKDLLTTDDIQDKLDLKEKELRSNPLPKQSVDGKGSEEK